MNTNIKKWTYLLSFITLVSIFALLYYAGYYYATRNHLGFEDLITREEVEKNNPGMKAYNETEDVAAAAEPVLTNRTTYIEECYHSDTGEMTSTTKEIPIELLGLNRTEMIDYLTTYRSEHADQEKTLTNIQLVSFSKDQVVIRKTVREPNEVFHYFVIAEDGIIKIYQADRTRLFADTGIEIRNIDEEHRKELENGFYIETIHELYNYLESITS